MSDFNHLQTFRPAKSAPFDYELFNVMKPYNIGDIVKDSKGKQWSITSVAATKAYYDDDQYRLLANTKF